MLFPPRFAPYVFAVLMSLYMVTLMTFVITWANTGLGEGFLGRWWQALYIAWPIALVLTLVGAPRLQRVVARLVRKPSHR
ncbi:DUF2798 domain-containing protein [Halomonas sp. KAO]|uniref:DUF2798 domain-containing protein n=1 Tax=unclassified Halomonas TaxID=2609666 RepID=UPI00189F696B|nr:MULTISPECIES: DUF2798 domain-containing protein [unclassified Halomonas]MBF7053530.1 DUF2798 domain-containing protein [Halomonas sp. KAO]MDT0500631.1 DUF2798 domain-containing protein [Halomonas sp. PAR7]MDT0513178.1 DUF2798 domain-containing protein [Halomonas sp. LES1]MDT0591411.1 DUF2798 domain-containing protein [Halomonas sp. PAR8]